MLVVDDDEVALAVLQRHLSSAYAVTAATDARAALELLAARPFAVVVSDLRMPEIDGAELLRRTRQVAPDTVRILLTGHADLDAAVTAVNEGGVFRFLFKPCPPQTLFAAVAAAVEQHRLLTAERELLEETLRGSVAALIETLSLANPPAFARAVRIRDLVAGLLPTIETDHVWAIELAAMLSQIGAVTLPPAVVEKLHDGRTLLPDEETMVVRLPEVAERILAPIPRLEPVREIIRWQHRRFDGRQRAQGPGGAQIPLGARILHAVIDYDELEARGLSVREIGFELRRRKGRYDPEILDELLRVRAAKEAAAQAQQSMEIGVADLSAGMLLVSDVRTPEGVLLVARGQKVTVGLLERLRNFAANVGVEEPLHVLTP